MQLQPKAVADILFSDPITQNDNTAIRRGFTRHVLIEGGLQSFAALIKPDTDLDGRFKAFDTDDQEWLFVNGWNVSVEDLE